MTSDQTLRSDTGQTQQPSSGEAGAERSRTPAFTRRLLGEGGWRWALLRLALLLTFLVITPLALTVGWMTSMPGTSRAGVLPPLPAEDALLRDRLRHHVQTLAGDVGQRNTVTSGSLPRTLSYLEGQLREMGYEPRRERYDIPGSQAHNLIVEVEGTSVPAEILLVGAHYDSVPGSPGADDNGSGCAALLELARAFSPAGVSAPGAPLRPGRTLRFVFFANEEKPFAMTPRMGSFVHATGCRKRGEKIVGMFSLESLGYFSDEPNSQRYPSPAFAALYPTTGNFIVFVGDTASRSLLHEAVGIFRRHATVPSEGAALPRGVPGVGWSDHWSFWVNGYQAVMITGTAPFRNPHYHTSHDTPDKLDYDRMARVVTGFKDVVKEMGR